MSNENVIIGAGVAGLGAAKALGYNCTCYEAKEDPGGLCGFFDVGGFRFDKAIHLSFANDKRVLNITHQTPHYVYHPYPENWYKQRWIKHPIQNNLSALSVDDRVQALLSYFDRNKEMKEDSFEEWCLSRYGKWIFDNILSVYNSKYWCCDLRELGISWIKNRIYQTSEKEILEGSFLDKTPNTYYAKESIYPKDGGFLHLWDTCIKRSRILTGHRVVSIDPFLKKISFENGTQSSYETIYSSIPLPELVHILNCRVDPSILEATDHLKWTSLAMVSVGFDTVIPFPEIWFYIYDTSIGAARAYSPSKASPANAPKGKSSLQFEFYFQNGNKPDRERCLYEVKSFLKRQGWLDHAEIWDFRTEPYANVIMTKEIDVYRNRLLGYLHKFSIFPIGRFGEWDYLWSDQAFLSGLCLAKKRMYTDD